MPERPRPVTTMGASTGARRTAGSFFQSADHAQPVLQDELELAPGAQAAGQVEPRLAVERGAQAGEGLFPPRVAEVVEAGRGRGGGAQVLGPERDQGAPVVADAPPERDHLVRPWAPRRWGPGHVATVPVAGENEG